MDKPISADSVLQHNRRYIPGGISSVNRSIDPAITFVRGEGAYLWDSEGKRYIDYHAGFAPYFLGHNFKPINEAAAAALASGDSLFGAGPSIAEGRLAELICEHVPHAEKITFLNTGSEATSLAIRIARAVTGRNHVIVMQGGYNGNHDELACNVFNTLAEIGPRVSPGEYPLRPLGAGTTAAQNRFTHAVNYNDLESVRYVCRRYPVAALITEPLLQNIGVVKPKPGYLEGLRDLADEFGFLLVFDEVKTGFRHALGGYAEVSGVRPTWWSMARRWPMAFLGGGGRQARVYGFHHRLGSITPSLCGRDIQWSPGRSCRGDRNRALPDRQRQQPLSPDGKDGGRDGSRHHGYFRPARDRGLRGAARLGLFLLPDGEAARRPARHYRRP
jgi:glutamate-1-semialdehyde 2,1-aminomutase